jgi:hypothetical protein
VAAATSGGGGGGGGGGSADDPEWDYLKANSEWVCRNAANGQFMNLDKCAYKTKVDNWPNS